MPRITTKSAKATTAGRRASVEVRPIRTPADHKAALSRLDALWGAPEGSHERDEFDVIALLVEAYEKEHHAIEPPSPIDAIRFRMEQMGWTRKELEAVIGTRARVSEILTGKRGLSLEMIRSIRREMGLTADVLVGTDAPRAIKTKVAPRLKLAAGGKRAKPAAGAKRMAGRTKKTARRRQSIEA